jgi:uncharacterized protein (DUF488 family)
MASVIYTTGYEQHATPGALVTALTEAGVKRLVDVRDLPLSRQRGFSKTMLAQKLAHRGIRYKHERPLGNPKPLRDLYKSGRQAEGESGYRAHIRNGSAWAVDWLADTLEDGPARLLCFERDHETCHRQVIVDELLQRLPTLQVEHL